jgi:hypothetical protein
MSDALKITSSHLARVAIVYLRQSSAAQVENNRESTDRPPILDGSPTMSWSSTRILVYRDPEP